MLSNDKIVEAIFSTWKEYCASTPDLMFIKDRDLVYICASNSFARLVNKDNENDIIGHRDEELFCDSDLVRRYKNDDMEILKNGAPIIDFIEPLPPKDGMPRYSSTSKYALRDDAGNIIGIYGIGRDVTRERNAEKHYHEELKYLMDLPDDAFAVSLLDVTMWRFVDFKTHADDQCGLKRSKRLESIDDLLNIISGSIVDSPNTAEFFRSLTQRSIWELYSHGRRTIEKEYLRNMANGETRWVREEIQLLMDPVAGHLMAIMLLRDIDIIKRKQHELALAAEQDSMTGLLNHDATLKHIFSYLNSEGKSGSHALFMIDIDNFKSVNDQLGHITGDNVIVRVAAAIRSTFRSEDVIGRIGGDEFLALMKGCSDREQAARKANELIETLQYSWREADTQMDLSASAGVSFYNEGKTLDTLYAEADTALYRAKNAGKKRYALSNDGSEERSQDEPVTSMPAGTIHLRTLLENMNGAVIIAEVTDGEPSVSYISPSYFRIFRREHQSVENKMNRIFDFILPEEKEKLFIEFLKASAECRSFDMTYKVYGSSGEIEWRRVQGTPLPGEHGGSCRMINIVTDITEMKHTEDQLREKTMELDALIESTPGGIFKYAAYSENDNFVFVSKNMLTLLGYTLEEFLEKFENSFEKMVWHEDRRRVLGEIDDQIKGSDFDVCEYRIEAKNGELKWVHDVGHLVRDKDGKLWFYVVIVDITNAKKTEEMLRTAELRSRTAIDQSSLLFWDVDIEKKTMVQYGALAREHGTANVVFENQPEEYLNRGFIGKDYYDEYYRLCQDISAGREGGEYYIGSCNGNGGGEQLMRVHFKLLRDSQGKPAFAVGVSEPVMHKRELELYRTMEGGGVFSLRVDDDLTLLYGNDRYFSIYGTSQEEMARRFGNKCSGCICAEELPRVRSLIIEALEGGKNSLTWVMKIHTASGADKQVQTSGIFERLADGTALMNGVVIDVTEQRLAAEALLREKKALAYKYSCAVELRDKIDHEAIGSFYLNLTQNTCGDCHSKYDFMLELQNSKTADEFFENCCIVYGNTRQAAEYRKIFNRKYLQECFENGLSELSFVHQYRSSEGTSKWIRSSVIMMKNPDTGDIEGIIYTHDINNEKTSEALIQQVIDLDYETMALIDAKSGALTFLGSSKPYWDIENAQFESELKYDDNLNLFAAHCIHPNAAEECLEKMSLKTLTAALSTSKEYIVTLPMKPKGAQSEYKKWQFFWLDDSRETIAYTRSDVTNIYAIGVDPLTGLRNRAAFCRDTRNLLDADRDAKYIILRFDIDHFKIYNDIYGADAGDHLLAEVGGILRRLMPEGSTNGYLQADHFIACIRKGSANIETMRRRIVNHLRGMQPGFDFIVRMGVYEIEDNDIEINIMCDRSMIALRSMKGNYLQRVAYYDQSMLRTLFTEQEIVNEMHSALHDGCFVAYLQPQYDQFEHTITGAEALARWIRSDGRPVPPSEFIPVFEKNGFITEFDIYIWASVCKLQSRRLKEGKRTVPVSVNISRIDTYNDKLCETLCDIADKYEVPHYLLRVEITESAYNDNNVKLKELVERLRKNGFIIEMDDFGSGYSTLNSLKDYHVDIIKLDMEFLNQKEDNSRGQIIIESVFRMADKLNTPIIAEGVETREQADFLKSVGCHCVQGYYFAKPMPEEKFEELLDG